MTNSTEVRHTPGKGEWKAKKNNKEDFPYDAYYISDNGQRLVAIVRKMRFTDRPELEVTQEEADNHARLIAAAPEILEILKVLVSEVECYCSDLPKMVCPIHEAKAAIAKAEGRS